MGVGEGVGGGKQWNIHDMGVGEGVGGREAMEYTDLHTPRRRKGNEMPGFFCWVRLKVCNKTLDE